MNIEEIYKLISVFEKSEITKLELEHEETKIKLSKEVKEVINLSAVNPVNTVNTVMPAVSENKEIVQKSGDYIKAPIAGTIYMAASPEEPPYVKEGDTVKKGDTVCIIEAMKMFNKIPAPCDCRIKEILVKNEEFAEFDADLFEIEVL